MSLEPDLEVHRHISGTRVPSRPDSRIGPARNPWLQSGGCVVVYVGSGVMN